MPCCRSVAAGAMPSVQLSSTFTLAHAHTHKHTHKQYTHTTLTHTQHTHTPHTHTHTHTQTHTQPWLKLAKSLRRCVRCCRVVRASSSSGSGSADTHGIECSYEVCCCWHRPRPIHCSSRVCVHTRGVCACVCVCVCVYKENMHIT